MKGFKRRDFIFTGLAGGFLAAAGLRGASEAPVPALPKDSFAAGATQPTAASRAKNIIFMVSDGMSFGTLALADRYLQRHSGRGSNWLGLYSRPEVRRASMDTASANSIVTDSAASSSAWGGGVRVNNGAINCRPDGSFSLPIMELAASSGLATGLVSTASITHATPAGFAAKVPLRADEHDIAQQYLNLGIDVLLGGGFRFFDAGHRSDHLDLLSLYSKAGYTIATSTASLNTAPPSGKLLGLFADKHMPYALDLASEPDHGPLVPSLSNMAKVALDRLSSHEKGFILQIEGARIDHGAHANDIGALLFDQLAFDEALGTVLAWVAGRDDTLVIVTSDHGNANPGLLGVGTSYEDTNACFDKLAALKHTNTWIMEGLSTSSSKDEIRSRVQLATGISLDAEELSIVSRAFSKRHREGYRVRNAPLITLAQVLSNHLSIGWSGVTHSTDYTELAAFGPGSESLQGLVRNTAMYPLMVRTLGLSLSAVPRA